MVVWENPFLLEYKPGDRAKYVDAFIANIDRDIVGCRIQSDMPESMSSSPKLYRVDPFDGFSGQDEYMEGSDDSAKENCRRP